MPRLRIHKFHPPSHCSPRLWNFEIECRYYSIREPGPIEKFQRSPRADELAEYRVHVGTRPVAAAVLSLSLSRPLGLLHIRERERPIIYGDEGDDLLRDFILPHYLYTSGRWFAVLRPADVTIARPPKASSELHILHFSLSLSLRAVDPETWLDSISFVLVLSHSFSFSLASFVSLFLFLRHFVRTRSFPAR